MPAASPPESARRAELLERSYEYVLAHGLAGISLRPLAAAVGSSPRVLLFLFGSKDGLVRALLARARAQETELLARARAQETELLARPPARGGAAAAGLEVWKWLAADEHRGLLRLWVESYARSLIVSDGPWGEFARETVDDWLALLAAGQPEATRDAEAAVAERTLVLAVLRGAMLDLLATGDRDRTTEAVRLGLQRLSRRS
jgi:AcrR family transcriptional regulator